MVPDEAEPDATAVAAPDPLEPGPEPRVDVPDPEAEPKVDPADIEVGPPSRLAPGSSAVVRPHAPRPLNAATLRSEEPMHRNIERCRRREARPTLKRPSIPRLRRPVTPSRAPP